MASSRTRPEPYGSRRKRRATSASSIPRAARCEKIFQRARDASILIRRSSTRTACCGYRASRQSDWTSRSVDRRVRLAFPADKDLAPYGIVSGADGALYVAEFGANKIARVDPATRRIKEFGLPNEDARPRRIAATSDGYIWYTDFTRGRLGGSILAMAKSAIGFRPAARNRAPMRSPCSAMTFGTSRPAPSKTCSCASNRRRGASSNGRSHRAAASCATWSRRLPAAWRSLAAASTKSRWRRFLPRRSERSATATCPWWSRPIACDAPVLFFGAG